MNKHFKRALIGATTLLAAAMLVGCSSKSSGGEERYVGISMPTKSAERWIADGTNMVKQLEKEGFKTDLQYGEDKVENQVAQIENMITKGVDTLVIAAIDGTSLTDVLEKAHEAKINVIKYTLPMLIQLLKTDMYRTEFGSMYLGISLSIAPLLIMYFILSKYIIRGVTAGGIKG